MIIFTRKKSETIIIDGHIKVMLVKGMGKKAKIGVECRRDISVNRGESQERIDAERDTAKRFAD